MDLKETKTDKTTVSFYESALGGQRLSIEDNKKYDSLEFSPNGEIQIESEGYRGECDHTKWLHLSIEQAVMLRDFLNEYVVDRHNDCDHLRRKPVSDDGSGSDPNFACLDCGYGT